MKCIKSPKVTTQNKQNSRKNKTNKNRKNNAEVGTNVDDETDNHLLIKKTKLSNDKDNKLSTRKRKKVETKSNQIVKKINVIESSSKSHNIQFDESIKSPIRKISTQQNNLKQNKEKEEIINNVTKNDEINKKSF